MTTATALIVGQGTLPVQCAGIFAQAGVVSAVCSPDEPLKTWADAARVPHFGEVSGLYTFAAAQPFDYLFSIVNYKLLKAEFLHLPACLAINYHDAPLPRYAGVYATTWALMADESSHGITWHVMTDRVDAGDILKQAIFPVSREDTAYSLNLKCYYSAISAFRELVPELIAGRAERLKQDMSKRTYFGLSKRLDNGGLVSFEWPAAQIDRFCRALDYEATPNPIGVPKMVICGRLFVVRRAGLTGTRSIHPPGTVTAIAPTLHVATATEDVSLPVIETISGRPVLPAELEEYGLSVGSQIQAADLSQLTHPE